MPLPNANLEQTPPAIQRALAAGVRSIEHGNWLDEETAALMAGEDVV
jgi:imidazolonepropionase-like amidohydrolase